MNKSILKHEIKSAKWIFFLGVLVSMIIVFNYKVSLDMVFDNLFSYGIEGNKLVFKPIIENINPFIIISFAILVIIQVFFQFYNEKAQDVSRFLKVLPIKSSEFLTTKLLIGVINITIWFIVLFIGIILIKNQNMFWVEDIYNMSINSDIFRSLDLVFYNISLTYLIMVGFYTFLMMMQYLITNTIAGIIIGVLIWFSPVFIFYNIGLLFETFDITHILSYDFSTYTNTFLYPFDYQINHDLLRFESSGINMTSFKYIRNLELKYFLLSLIIVMNTLLSLKISKDYLVENDNKLMPMKLFRIIFIVGVTVCSALLVEFITINMVVVNIFNVTLVLFMAIGGFLGYLISKKISKIA